MSVSRRLVWPILLAAIGAGCAGAPPPPPKPKESPPIGEAAGPGFVTPAHWDFHPAVPESATGWARVGDGGCVFTSDGGQRWVTTPDTVHADKSPPSGDCTGKAEVSPFLASEDLRSVVRRSDKSWIFIGESGALYEAPDPLAAFVRTVEPPEPLAHVSGVGSTILAATFGGKILRWDDASGWRPVPSQPAGARVFDVAVAEGGRALALAFPEALFTSADGGSSWAPAAAPPIGARSLGLSSGGDLAAQGLLESLEIPKTGAFRKIKSALRGGSPSLDLTASRAPSSAAVAARRAVLDGDRYAEVVRPDSEGDDWILARGKIEGRLTSAPIPKTSGCGSVWIGGRGKILYLACVSQDSGDITAEIKRSQDGGDTFPDAITLSTPDTDQISIGVSPEGNALVTGVCKSTEGGGCRPTAPILVRPEGGKLKAMVTSAPQLSGLALLPAFSVEGRSAYFLGRRTKDDKITLFVSHDGGETFSQRPLESPSAKPVKRNPDDDDGESEPSDDYVEVDDSSSLRPGEDGTIGLMVLRYHGYTYLTTDEDGRVIGAVVPPIEDAIMGGYGRRVVAFASQSEGRYSDQQTVRFWESVDGGSSWEESAAPAALGRDYNRGGPGIACSLGGCLFSDTVSRVGWGGQVGPSASDVVEPGQPSSAPSVLTPIVCELSSSAKWTRIEHVSGSTNNLPTLPDINQAMRGRSVWSVLTIDQATGAVGAVSATLPDAGDGDAKIVTKQILGPRPGGSVHAATHVSRQMEGYAAVRATFPLEKNGDIKPGTAMKNVEVAWENYMEGTSNRARIADAGPLERTDIAFGGGDYILDTGMITVTARSIVVRPHSARSRTSAAYFLDAAGKSERFTLPTYPNRGINGYIDVRGEVVAVDGQPLAVGLVKDSYGNNIALFLGHRLPPAPGAKAVTPAPPKPAGAKGSPPPADPADSWDLLPMSITPGRVSDGPILVQSDQTDWTYSGKTTIGITSLVGNRKRSQGWAFFHSFRADGTFAPPVPLATLLDLGDRPRPCSAADRAASPRFESPFFAKGEPIFPGMRHPVLVSEPPAKNAVGVSDPVALLTAAVISHGTPASPCVAAWEAKGIGRSTVTAILSGDLAHSWMFRSVPPDPGRPTTPGRRPEAPSGMTLEYRPMACHYDPSARIPDGVWAEPGTARITP